MVSPLSDNVRTEKLGTLDGWIYREDRKALYRKLKFRDFAEALATMVQIGVVAEKRDHHPEWFNVYDRLEIWLTTHDAGGVSECDIELATAINAIITR